MFDPAEYVRPYRRRHIVSTMWVMIRNVFAVLATLLLALLAVMAVWAIYDLASIYGDPTGSELAFFRDFGSLAAVALVLMLAVATVAVALARGRPRRVLTFVAAGVFALTIPGIFVANHYGHADKRRDTASPPTCGIRNPGLDEEFRRLDHPGYFGGGNASRVGCSYLLDAHDSSVALDVYEERLARLGYKVRRTRGGVDATSQDYYFRIRLQRAAQGGDHLTVSLRERGKQSPGSVV